MQQMFIELNIKMPEWNIFTQTFFNLKSKNSLFSIFGVQGIRLGIARDAKINERDSFLQQLIVSNKSAYLN